MKTVVTEWIGSKVIGYTLNVEFSLENQKLLGCIAKSLRDKFPEAVWPTPVEALHATLLDWISTQGDYGRDKEDIFKEIFKAYDQVFEDIFADQGPITVDFSELKVTPDAVIATGHDDGSFQRIRQAFLSKITPIPCTKVPPKIIHTTLCRFLKESPIEDIQNALNDQAVSFKQEVETFRLLKTLRTPMLESQLIKEYKLK